MLMMAAASEKAKEPEEHDLCNEILDNTDATNDIFDRYGDDNGMTEGDFGQFLVDLHNDIYKKGRGSVKQRRQSASTRLIKLASRESFKRHEDIKSFAASFPKTRAKLLEEVPIFDKADENMKARCHPRLSAQSDKASKVFFAESADSELSEYALKDQYTWDYCLVFKIGDPDKIIVVPNKPDSDDCVDEDQKAEGTTKSVSTAQHYHEHAVRMIGSLESAGLKVFTYLSVQEDELYCLIGADEVRLAVEADRTGMEIPLDPVGVKKLGVQYHLDLARNYDKLHEHVFKGLYGQFRNFQAENDERKYLYRVVSEGKYHPSSYFRQVDRLKLIHGIIGATTVEGGADLELRRNLKDKKSPVLAYFPLHHMPNKQALYVSMLNSWGNVFYPPVDKIKNYFGEELAMYFCFLSYYTWWLLPPAVAGMAYLIYMCTVQNDKQNIPINFDAPGAFSFGLIVCIWSTAFLEAWGRKQSMYASIWGMTNLDEREADRPEFEGKLEVDAITGQLIQYFPFVSYLKRLVVARFAVLFLVAMVVSLMLAQVVLRQYIIYTNEADGSLVLIGLAALQFVCIQTMNAIYGYLATFLNDWENHRTDTQYESAKIFKSFLFKCVNTYYSFTYIILFKRDFNQLGCQGSFELELRKLKDPLERGIVNGTLTLEEWYAAGKGPLDTDLSAEALHVVNLGPDYNGDCVLELAIQLGTVFILALVVNNAMEIGIPWLQKKYNARKEAVPAPKKQNTKFSKLDEESAEGCVSATKSDAEEQCEFVQYEGTFGDYDELVVQFGYAVLFVTAFPVVPLLAFFNNVVEYRLDATKILDLTRRPIPKGRKDIGLWHFCLTVLSWLAILFIVAITTFSSEAFAQNFFKEQPGFHIKSLGAFIVMEHCLFFVKILVAFFIPDAPESVLDHKRRCDLIVEAVVNRKNV